MLRLWRCFAGALATYLGMGIVLPDLTLFISLAGPQPC